MTGLDVPGNGRRPLYEPAPWLVVRTPLLPVNRISLVRDPRRALEDPDVVRALAIGCPDLLASLQRPTTKERDRARADSSLARYLIRMSTRPTPYGAFAAVSLAAWDTTTSITLSPAQRLRTRPDMGWAIGLLRRAEADPSVRASLRWRRQPLTFERDGRFVVAASGASVKATRVSRLALDLAGRPIPFAELRDLLLEKTEGTAFQVETLLTELWQQGLLVTELRPRLTGSTATSGADIAERLRTVRPETASAIDELLDLMRAFDEAPPAEAVARLAAVDKSARAIGPVDQTAFQVDLARPLLADTLSAQVAAECARAAELLLRITPAPGASPDLTSYQRSFEARYGPDHEVPLLELIDPVVGLGPMPHSHGADPGMDPRVASRRTETLMALALEALRDGARQVELDKTTVAALQTWSPNAESAPLSLDLSAFVIAANPQDLDRGEFSVVIGPNLGASSAGRWLGRFADLLPESSSAYADLLRAEAAARPGPVPAEVVYLPANPRTTNVVLRPTTADYEIVIDAHADGAEVIELEDLVVGSRAGRLYLRSLRLGREVRPTARHMLNHHGAPPLCQFFDELAYGVGPRFTSFSWGSAESLPVLPRVTSGRIVLEPARWRLPVRQSGSKGQVVDLTAFRADLVAWRARWDVPARVYASTADNRLLLDLDDDRDVEQLHREARQRPGADLRLYEALPDVADAWLPGPDGTFLSEIVVPLVLRPAQTRAEPREDVPVSTEARARTSGGVSGSRAGIHDRLRAPGSDWLFAKFYLPADRMDELLTGPIADLCTMAENSSLAESWFFLRYSDPEPHLRVRWRGEPSLLLQQLLPQVTAFAEQLIDGGQIGRLVLDTYERELDRYGGPDGTTVSEQLFHADSRTVLQLLAMPTLGAPGDRTDLGVLTVHRMLGALGLDAQARLAFYLRQVGRTDDALGRSAGEDYRTRKTRLRSLLGPDGAAVLDPSGQLDAVLRAFESDLATAAATLARLEAGGALTARRDSLWPSYVHMHHNRLIGGSAMPNEAHLMHLLRRTQEGLLLSARR